MNPNKINTTHHFLLLVFTLFFLCSYSNKQSIANSRQTSNKNLIKKISQVKFLENKGQMINEAGNPVPNVLFKCEAPGVNVYITTKGLSYQFFKIHGDENEFKKRWRKGNLKEEEKEDCEMERMDLNLVNSHINPNDIQKESPLPGHFNYFYSHCPDGIYGVKQYEKIRINNVYPGIDWVLYHSTSTGFKYDFIVHPGADPNQITLQYISFYPLTKNEEGDLIIKEHFGSLQESKPYTYYEKNKEQIQNNFSIVSQIKNDQHFESIIKYQIPETFNRNETIVIDPDLEWSTFFGGNGNEGALCADTDTSGNLFLTGYALDVNFPLQNAGTYFQSSSLGYTPHIIKFSNSGTLLWATFYSSTTGGTSGVDQKGFAISTDLSGNVFVTGVCSSTNFPVQNASTYFQGSFGGFGDIFILKFDNAGNRLWATYFGGSGYEEGNSISTDAAGNLFVTGYTSSTNFPLLNASTFFQGSIQSHSLTAFILKFTNTGNLLLSTYYGDGAWIKPVIKVDNNGNVYLCGSLSTSASSVPLLNPGGGVYFQNIPGGQSDCYISKFSNAGNLLWSTYYGGSSDDQATSMAKDNNGNIFICGTTLSGNFPLLNAGSFFQGTISGTSSGFISKFGNAGNLIWSTLYNGFTPAGRSDNLEVDSCGNVYMSGTTGSTTVQTMYPCNGTFTKSYAALGDIFLTRFSNSGDLYWATYFGGDGPDFYAPLALDKRGNLFVAGEWTFSNTNYVTLNPGGGAYYNASNNGGDDMYVAKFHVKQIPEPKNYFKYQAVVCLNGQNLATLTPTITIPGGSFSSSPVGLSIDPLTGIITVSTSAPGTYSISYGNFSCGCYNNVALTSTFAISIPPTVSINNASVCSGSPVTLVATGVPSTGLIYSWSSPGSSSPSLAVSPTISTSYSVTVTNSLGCANQAISTITVLSLPNLTLSGNNFICPGESSTITISGASSYTWNTGAFSNSINPSPIINTVYSVSASDANNCVNTASILVSIKPSPILSVTNPTVCAGDYTTLTLTTIPSTGVNYTWMPGGIQNTSFYVQANAPMTYSIFSDLNGCTKLDSIKITVTPTLEPITSFQYNSPYCKNNANPFPVLATGFSSGGIFSNSTGLQIDNTSGLVDLKASPQGSYQIQYMVDRLNCVMSGTGTAILEIEDPIILSLSKDKRINPGSSTTITVSGSNSYTWSPDIYLSCSNCSNPIATPPTNIQYCVESKNNSCLSKACVNIEVGCMDANELMIANAFSPNGDNQNDLFCLQGWSGCVDQFRIIIFDRWGEKVFESTDPSFCWDGIYRGTLLNSAVYVYVIDARIQQNESFVKKGNITLIR